MVTIRVRENGPLIITDGNVQIVDSDGTTLTSGKLPTALCRCGCSKSKPFCDGAHQEQGRNS